MNIEEVIFANLVANPTKLQEYGFIKEDDRYRYETKLAMETFQVFITVTGNTVMGNMYDLFDGTEYTNFRVHSMNGAFVNGIKAEYKELLNDIAQKCFDGTLNGKHWLIPANPKYYDIANAFNDTNEIIWKQSNNIKVGDIVYQYVANPISAILYQCRVKEVDIPYSYQGKDLTISKVMRIELLKRYNPDVFTFQRLQSYGVTAIRGPRSIPDSLLKDLNAEEE